MGTDEHRQKASETVGPVRIGWVTVSDSRTEETDEAARLALDMLQQQGMARTAYSLIPNDPQRVAAELERLLAADDVDAIIFSGGTGVSSRDVTLQTVAGRFERELPGFGELFRMLSYQDIGAAAMLSRAALGVVAKKPVVSLPGSKGAVRLALERLLLPELQHLLWEVRR